VYIGAPYEADAQLAYLSRTGIANLVIKEDSDLIVYGCDRVSSLKCTGLLTLFKLHIIEKMYLNMFIYIYIHASGCGHCFSCCCCYYYYYFFP